jgi:uncharacterized protein (TIRG00374 family)
VGRGADPAEPMTSKPGKLDIQASPNVADDQADTSDVHGNVDIEPLPRTAPRVRRPVDVLRLILALAVLVGTQLLAAVGQVGVRTSERALLDSLVTLPALLRDSLTGGVQLLFVLLPAALFVAMAITRRFALIARLLIAVAGGLAVGVLDSHLLLGQSHPSAWPGLLAGRSGIFAVTFPPVAWLSGTAAMLTVCGPELSRRWRGGLWWLTGTAAAVEVTVGGFLPVDAVMAVASGVAVGSLVLLAFGESASRPAASQVVAALEECGVALKSLTELTPPTDGPAAFLASTSAGSKLAVRVYATDDRDRDRLARFNRWLLVRHPHDDRAGTTVESAAEHELLAMVAAVRAGARVPEPAVAYPVAGGRGPGGALVAWSDVGGCRLDLISPDQVSEAVLADLWHSVGLLGKHRLAHRLLRTDNIFVDHCNRAWITGWVLAELGASDEQLHTDMAELLTSLAVQVGADRTVASAVAGLGGPPVAAAAALLQPLALSGPTRAKVRAFDRARSAALSPARTRRRLRPGDRPDLLKDLRTGVSQASGEPAAQLEPLSRFTWKRALSLLGAFVVVYLVLPQLANAGAAIRALRSADWWWVLAALPAIFVAQAFSTVLLRGTIPAELPFGPTYAVQFGGSFLNRVTPNNVGGMALNFRYLQKAGVDAGAATGSVGLQTLASDAATLLLLTVFFARTGRHTAVHFGVHSRQWLFLVITAVLVAGALLGLTPRGRRFFHDRIWSFLRSAGSTIAEVAKSPHQVALIGVGAVCGPLVQIAALALCVHALGGDLPVVQVGAVYLGAHLVASAAPVPGGLGALEAALIAGLSGLGMAAGAAASAVLIYRLLTYWMTIPVGWTALKIAEGRGYI